MKSNRKSKIMLCILLILSITGYFLDKSFQEGEDKLYSAESKQITSNNSEFIFNYLPQINATLFSESNNNSNHLEIVGDTTNPSTNATINMKLPSPPQFDQWFGWNTSLKIYNLLDNRTWGKGNYDFSSGTDNGTVPIIQDDDISAWHNDTITNWECDHWEKTSAGWYNDMTIEYSEAQNHVNLSYYGRKIGASYLYEENEYLAIEQQGYDVFRGAIKNAWIRIIYNPVKVHKSASLDCIRFSAELNGEMVYKKSSIDFGSGLTDTGWIPSGAWINTSNVFPAPSPDGYSNFESSLILKCITGFTTSGVTYNRIQIHGFYLALEAFAMPNTTDIQLKVNNKQINGSFGEGYIQWINNYPDFISANPYKLLFNSSYPLNLIDLNFDVDVNFKVLKFVGTTITQNRNDLGVKYIIDSPNNKIKYKFYQHIYWDYTTFSNFYFNFSIPTDWNITIVKNPALVVVFNKTANYNLGIIGGNESDGYVSIPSQNSMGQVMAEIPGWWYFEAECSNYFQELELFKKVGNSWISSTEFNSSGYYDGDQLKIKTTINNKTGVPPCLEASTAYLEILLPNGSVLLTQKNDTINTVIGDVIFGPFVLAGINTTGGVFQAQVYWNNTFNYLSGFGKIITPGSCYYGVGYSKKNFTVIHDSTLKIINPLDAQDDLEASLDYFDVFPLKVLLNDTDINALITGGSVQINWTSILDLEEISAGYYSITLDTTDLGNPGIYLIQINSSKVGFTNTSLELKLNIIAESVLDDIISPATAEFGKNFTFKVFYHLPGNPNYNYSNAQINISTLPASGYLTLNEDYIYTDFGNGNYNITVFSGEDRKINKSGNVEFYIHTSKDFIENASQDYSLFLRPIETELILDESFYQIPKYESINLTVKYQIKGGSESLDGGSITLNGISNYTIRALSEGYYEIELEAGNQTKSYSISISANKQNYAVATVNVILLVKGLDAFTQINVSKRSSTITIGETTDFVFTFNYTYIGEYFTSEDINVTYEWAYGSGELEMRGANEFILIIENTYNIPPDKYQIIVSVYDNDNNLITQELLELNIIAIPPSPWIYSFIGLVIIALIIFPASAYYFKYYKPKEILKNKALMEKYNKYADAQNIKYLFLIEKNLGVKLSSRNYGSEKEIDEDLIVGFLQAVTSFGQEISGVEAAVMENITYEGLKILLENGKYVNSCLLLKEEETANLKQKIRKATEEFEEKFENDLKDFKGDVGAFKDNLDNFDKIFEIYLKEFFKIDHNKLIKKSIKLNKTQRRIIEIVSPKVPKKFSIDEVFNILKVSNLQLIDVKIFAELYDLIQKEILIPQKKSGRITK